MPKQSRSVTELRSGDYVKTGRNTYEKIESIHGVGPGGRLAKPSEGGFSVVTESGRTVSMWQAKSYHKAEDMHPDEIR